MLLLYLLTLATANAASAIEAQPLAASVASASWTKLLASDDAADLFFSEVYQQRMHVFNSALDGLKSVDSWISELQQPNDFVAKYWDTVLDTANAASLRDSRGKELALPSGSWQDFQRDFYSNGMSMVVRREHMAMDEAPLEAAIKGTMRSSGATTHAYLSADQAHALEPHVDP